MEDIKRPGVYIDEISLLPPSVAGVSTAVPAFLGYTRNNPTEPKKITSLLEFTTHFGAPNEESFTADFHLGEWRLQRKSNEEGEDKDFYLYYLLKMFFNNGGKVCYVVSVGDFNLGKSKSAFINAFEKLEKEDEPTLIVLGDAVTLGWQAYKEIAEQALMQCGKLKDRFAILDVMQTDDDGSDFRKLSSSFLRYGAAYTPFLRTSLNYELGKDFAQRITVKDNAIYFDTAENGLRIKYTGDKQEAVVKISAGELFKVQDADDTEQSVITMDGVNGAKAKEIVAMWPDTVSSNYEVYQLGNGEAVIGTANDLTFEEKKIYKILNENDDPCIILTYTGDVELPKVELNLGKNNWGFNLQTGVFKIDVKNGGDPIDTDLLLEAFDQYYDKKTFKMWKVGSGRIPAVAPTDMVSSLGIHLPVSDPAKGLMLLYSGEKEAAVLHINAPEITFVPSTAPGEPIVLEITGVGPGVYPATIIDDWVEASSTDANLSDSGFDLISLGKVPVEPLAETGLGFPALEDIKNTNTQKYNLIKAKLNDIYLTLPPSGAIAGVYSLVDQERGVWKAPANVGLMSVIGPDVKITDLDQNDLNIDPTGGKSINAIRNFTGKGTLVWGARTLAGNDNEWRYINVRRLFNMIEESTKKATEAFIFEPNTASTWIKVKGMIESYLFGLWQKGALAGAKPEDAYFVNVGLGKTMTQQDILEGTMNVEIGIAAVRPAEFIVLKFSHKLQVS